MQKRICFVVGNYNNGGGTERVLSIVANGLAKCPYEIMILSLGKGLNPTYETDARIQLQELNISSSYLHKTSGNSGVFGKVLHEGAKTIWRHQSQLIITNKITEVLRQWRPDVVVAVDLQMYHNIEPVRRKLGFSTIAWEHFSLDGKRGVYLDYSRHLATKYASRVVVLGNEDLKAYQKKYPKATNLQRIYNPLAFELSNNIQVQNKVVVAAGRYAPQKGFDLLLEAWAKIAKQVPDWELRIFGDGPDRGNLQEFIDAHGIANAKLCGFTNCLNKEMENASIFALSSRYEGFVLVLLEAQAKGLPCVSFSCPQGPVELIDDGVNGLLVPPGNTEVFAEKLLMLMQDTTMRQSFSENSQKDLYRFEPSTVVEQWVALIDSI